ncbi:hypothetical protein ACWGIV_25905 [Streptomyces sp. NPDC054844]
MRLARYWKAVTAAVVAGAGSLSVALEDGAVTAPEIVTAVFAVAAAAGFTWAVPNKPKEGQS